MAERLLWVSWSDAGVGVVQASLHHPSFVSQPHDASICFGGTSVPSRPAPYSASWRGRSYRSKTRPVSKLLSCVALAYRGEKRGDITHCRNSGEIRIVSPYLPTSDREYISPLGRLLENDRALSSDGNQRCAVLDVDPPGLRRPVRRTFRQAVDPRLNISAENLKEPIMLARRSRTKAGESLRIWKVG
jgi:hypothetical protein